MSQPPISPRTRVFGVIGDPIEHSLSPLMHNYMLESLGLDARYLAFHVQREQGAQVGLSMRTLGLSGLNVTLPHKETAAALSEVLSDEARDVGAVNTLGWTADKRLAGHNTDVAGFLGALELNGLKDIASGQSALVLGAGGAARAILYALGRSGVRQITLANRTISKADDLIRWFIPLFPSVTVRSIPLNDSRKLAGALETSALTVNVTPLGMAPRTDESPLPAELAPRPGSLMFDTIYNPERTLMLERAARAGCVTLNGLDMLIVQGMESLCWWLGEELPWRSRLEGMRALLRQALAER